jgi:hypothetical protein
MELYVSGVKVPTLGSFQDKVLRQFLTKRAVREVNKNKVVALSAVAMANMSKTPSETVKEILHAFSDYVNMELFLENVREETELMMRDEYEFWRKVRPKINISKDGKGASLSVSSLKPTN